MPKPPRDVRLVSSGVAAASVHARGRCTPCQVYIRTYLTPNISFPRLCTYMDRANLSFAAAAMNADLGFSTATCERVLLLAGWFAVRGGCSCRWTRLPLVRTEHTIWSQSCRHPTALPLFLLSADGLGS